MPPIDSTRDPRYLHFSRPAWSALRENTPLTLSEDDLRQLRGLNDRLSLDDVVDVYLPLSRLLNLHVGATRQLHDATATFLGQRTMRVPYIIGIAGSVAVGKSTTARVLAALLRRWPDTPAVDLITTDGFLLPNATLESRGILHRKGFPESYDVRRLLGVVADVKAGAPAVRVPVYSHTVYDVVPDVTHTITQPDILIVEGLNVLQPARLPQHGEHVPFVSDFFDFSVYLDADEALLRAWYIARFMRLRETAFRDPRSYFARYAALDADEAAATATRFWDDINRVNLRDNILPTRQRAKLILRKGALHQIEEVALRRGA